MRRAYLPLAGVVCGYVLVAVAFSWPLPLRFGSALTGDPGGDTGVYVWNQWVFQHEALVERRYPLRTSQILSLTDRVDLSQHNYTPFLNLLALPLIPLIGVISAFNLVLLIANVLTAICTYLLARRATTATRGEAWLAGLAFAWSPVLLARSTGHFSLVTAAPLALFLYFLLAADRSRRARDAAFAGAAVAWAAFCDPYLAVFCCLIMLGYLASRMISLSVATERAPTSWRWTLNVAILTLAGLVLGLLLDGGGRFEVLGVPVSIRGLYTPVLLLTTLVIVRLAMPLRARLAVPT